MKIELSRLDDSMNFLMTDNEGHQVQSDASVDDGGNSKAPRPTTLLLMSLASCSSIDVVLILKKMKQELIDIKVEVEGIKDRTQVPALFKTIHLKYKLFGDIPKDKAERAVRMSMETYCSVVKTIESVVSITWEAEVLPAEN